MKNKLKGTADRPEIQVLKEYGHLPPVDCYPGQLNQVFMNILSNAIDALIVSRDAYPDMGGRSRTRSETHGKWMKNDTNPQKGDRHLEIPTITIRTELVNDRSVVIQIADNGPGMTEVVKTRLFEEFFTTKPVGKGTGLVCQLAIRLWWKSIKVSLNASLHSVRGRCFLLKFPCGAILIRFKGVNKRDRTKIWLRKRAIA
ncbi:MAG: HAMP domain-containing histidine kinase [Hormoscilla sp. GM7CHS1pb]|nr:HAMP domain-containing histidine kinase [Hormoscilla sp. GM7CHS1pb]